MYETEANRNVESCEQLPAEVIAAFSGLQGKIARRTVLPWSEHCTECVWPTCYTSCDLYSPREDGRCRRFVDGMVRVECPSAVNGYLLKIRFKKWGKLWTPASLNLQSTKRAGQIEKQDYYLGQMLYKLPVPVTIKNQVIGKRYSWKKRRATRGNGESDGATCFLLECYNPTEKALDISLTIRSANQGPRIAFQRLLRLQSGYQIVRIPTNDIATMIDVAMPFNIELIPNGFDEEIALYFGLMDFVREADLPVAGKGRVKCVVWDLDNTLWDGVLVEDGKERLSLKPEIKTVIEELDRRGILQSVASKNNYEEAMEALKASQLTDFFLYPQISWAPKGDAIRTIASRLNIGIESLLFVDDQEFERNQVEASCAGVRTLAAERYMTLLNMTECQAPVTAESLNRRKMYRVEEERKEIQRSFKDDYKAFLIHCDIRLTVTPLTLDNLERVHELTQRTNQMNFSGNRYDRSVLEKIVLSADLDTYVLACTDRFGDYGIVGFGVVDNREPRLVDLMFSCRIQSKRVEHAFLRTIINKYLSETGKDFTANYRKTPRNLPSGQVFQDLGMIENGVKDGVTLLTFPRGSNLPDDGIVQVDMPESSFIAGPR